MAIKKSSTFEVSSPVSSIVGVLTFLMSPNAKTKAEDESVKAIAEGFHQMLNGLSAVLKGSEIKLNEMISVVLDTEKSVLSDSDIESIQQLESLVATLKPLISDEEGFPEELRRSIARVIERGEMLISLELQLRPYKGEVIHVKFDANKLHQEVSERRDVDASGWDEDE